MNLHSAAGVGHGLGNVFTAFRNRTPLVVVAGQQARSLLVGEPFLFAERPAEFGEPYVKFSREPARAADVPATLARAIHVASTPPCGPVLVSVPGRRLGPARGRVSAHRVVGSVAGDPDALAHVADHLAAASAPAFVVGGEVDRDGAFDDVVALAERHAARVYAAPMSPRCGFPERHRLFGGFLPAAHDGIRAALREHDLVLVLGAPVFPFHTEGGGGRHAVPEGTTLVQLTDDPAHAAWTPVGTSIVTGVRHGVHALLAGPPPPERPLRGGRARPRARGRRRRHHRGAAAADPRGPAAGRLRGRRGGPGARAADARPPALRPARRASSPAPAAGWGTACPRRWGGAGAVPSGSSRSSGTARRCTASRRCGRRRSRVSR